MHYINKIRKKGFIGCVNYIKYCFIKCINTLAFTFCLLFKRDEYSIVLESEGDCCDNAYALYNYMKKNGYLEKYKITWLVEHPENFQEEKKVNYVQKNIYNCVSFKTIFRLRTCHWYIYDHCNIMSNYKKRDNQIFIYLSHGWGYKASKGGSLENCKSKFDYMTATGPVSAEGLSKYWNSDIKNTIVTGYPRLDYFFGEDSPVLNHINNIWKFDKYTKVFFWMPTFRQSTNQALTENYIKSETGLPILETLDMLKKLDSLLSNINVLLVFKIHHLQLELPVFNNKFNNIIFINDEELRNNNIQLYQLIKCADALISDYSSISIDYLLLDRPIIYTLDDYEQYDKSRGLFPHNAIDYMPGYHVYTVEELNNSIIEIRKGIDRYSDDRKLVMNNYHTYRDGNSSRRILDMFDIKK